jgi:hypothetical protein
MRVQAALRNRGRSAAVLDVVAAALAPIAAIRRQHPVVSRAAWAPP